MRAFKPILFLVGLGELLLALSLLPPRPLFASPSATTFSVDTQDDRLDDDTSDGVCHTSVNTCALRAALMQANHLTGPGLTTILIPAGTYTLTRPIVGGDGEDSGDLNLTTPLSANQTISLLGAGASATVINANQIDRVLTIAPSRVAIIRDLTLRRGFSAAGAGGLANSGRLEMTGTTIAGNESGDIGGGIYNTSGAALTLSHSVLSGNKSAGDGAGIYSGGTLTLTHSTVSGNQTPSYGGGLYSDGPLTLTDSTVSGNQAGLSGGGLYNSDSLLVVNSTLDHNHVDNGASGKGGGLLNSGLLTVINSTLSHNTAVNDGGGLYNANAAQANLYNTTIVFNDANSDADAFGQGGGVYNYSGAILNLRNALVAGNTASNTPPDECLGALGLYGVNLIGLSQAGVTNCSLGGPGFWTYLNDIDLLGELQNNGGPTRTHALLSGSNAIDGDQLFSPMDCIAPDSSPLPTDQRGFTRVVGSSCDIGAFEYGPLLYLPLVMR